MCSLTWCYKLIPEMTHKVSFPYSDHPHYAGGVYLPLMTCFYKVQCHAELQMTNRVPPIYSYHS